MYKVLTPFVLAPTETETAIAEVTFSPDSNISQFSRITVARLKFMNLYEQEIYNANSIPLTEHWGRKVSDGLFLRGGIAAGGSANFYSFGHTDNPELTSLDQLPHLIEIELVATRRRRDDISFTVPNQIQFQSIQGSKEFAKPDNNTLTSLLTLQTTLVSTHDGGYHGSVTCDNTNLGSFNVRNQGLADTFTIRVKMFDFKHQALSKLPEMELGLLIR